MSTSTIHSRFTPNTSPSDRPIVSSEDSLGTMESDGKEYYYFKVGTGSQSRFYMFESPEARQEFMEWLSLSSGVEIDDLTTKDIRGVLKNYDIIDDYLTTTGQVNLDGNKLQSVWLTFIKAPMEEKIDGQAQHEFFGADVPYFADGAAPYLNNRDITFTGDHKNDGARLAGLAGSARVLVETKYGNQQTTPVDAATLDKGIQALCKSLFGDVPLTLEHLNILKQMGLVKGDATQGAASWTLSEAGVATNDAFAQPETADFVASMGLNSMSPEDLIKAAGTSTYFNDKGFAQKPNSNPPAYYGTGDVETLAREAYSKMKGSDESLPEGLKAQEGQQEAVLKLIVNLLGLPQGTTFDQLTPAQINAAIATGMVSYDKDSNTLSISLNGETYAKTKAESTQQTPPPASNPEKSFYDAMSTFYTMGGATGADRAEVNDDKGVKNDRFGTYGIGKLAGADANDDSFWNDVGLGHLSKDDRTKLINASKDILKYGGTEGSGGYLDQISSWGGGSGLGLGVFKSGQIQEWLKNNTPK